MVTIVSRDQRQGSSSSTKVLETSLYLVCELKLGEARDVPGPLHGGEEDPGGELADIVDADHVVTRHLDLE